MQIKNNKFFEIKNLTENTAEIKIYGTITKWAYEDLGEVSSVNFIKELEKFKNVSNINLRVNSPGGDVFEAVAIYNFLKHFSQTNNIQVTGYIDGLAASAASFLVLCASKIVMGVGALFMIHNPSAYAYGNSEALQKEIELLNTVKEAILDIYCSKSKLARDKISEEMNNEKWFNAKQALEAGFVDEIVENDNSLENIKKISNELNINNFIHKDFLEEKLKVIKNTGGEKMIKNISDLLNDYPQLMEEFKNQVSNEIKEVETKKVENAILEERKRIEALEKIPFMNDKQKEIINKAKYEVPRTPTEIMAEFFMSNANKASEEISKIKAEHEENEITKISPSTEDLKNSLDEQLINAALNAFNER